MAKGQRERKWREKLLDWQASDKTVQAWCKAEGVSLSAFYSWKKRLRVAASQVAEVFEERGFVELKDQRASEARMTLEYGEIKIQVQEGFSPLLLKECLTCLRGFLSC